MNFKEAIKEIKHDNCDDCESPFRFNADCDGCHHKCAIKTLENAHKYRWHDLRKNPNDLPEHNNKVNVLYRKRNTTGELKYGLDRVIGDYPSGWKGFQKGNRVVAWKEIEPYE